MPPPIRVLAAVIERDGRYLLGLRPAGKRHAGQWEFPGGKVEPGESDAQAMARELHEELGLGFVAVGHEVCVQHDGASPFEIHFLAVTVTGEPVAHEHEALAWIAPHEFGSYPLAPSDAVCAAVLRDQRDAGEADRRAST